MVSIDDLARDENSIVQGAFRILHRSPAYHGPVGAYDLERGESTRPAAGRLLLCALNEYGGDVFLEPWGDLPPGFVMPDGVRPEVPAATLARLRPCLWRDSPAATPPAEGEGDTSPADDGLDALDLEALQALVVELGQTPGNKQEKALRKLIRAERAKATPPAEGEGD